jgi:hypothetical protein
VTPLSSAAILLSIVARVTGCDVDFIARKMPLARAYQYQTIYYCQNGIKCERPRAIAESGLKQII